MSALLINLGTALLVHYGTADEFTAVAGFDRRERLQRMTS